MVAAAILDRDIVLDPAKRIDQRLPSSRPVGCEVDFWARAVAGDWAG